MNGAAEFLQAVVERPRQQSKERFGFRRPGVYVANGIQIPGAHPGRRERQTIALLAGMQGCLGLLASEELLFDGQPCAASNYPFLSAFLQAGLLCFVEPRLTDICDPDLQLVCGDRSAEEVTLSYVTAEPGQHVPGRTVLNA